MVKSYSWLVSSWFGWVKIIIIMEFLFECSTQHVTHLLRSLMRYQVEHSKRSSIRISKQPCIILFIIYINVLLTRRGRLNSRFKKRLHCHSWHLIEWVTCQQLIGYLKHEKLSQFFMCGDIAFLGGGNRYEALQLKSCHVLFLQNPLLDRETIFFGRHFFSPRKKVSEFQLLCWRVHLPYL